MSARKRKVAEPVVAPRKRRLRRTRAQMEAAADLATARGAIENIMSAELPEPVRDYDNIAARLREIEQDIKSRIQIVRERYEIASQELGNLNALTVGVGPSVAVNSTGQSWGR